MRFPRFEQLAEQRNNVHRAKAEVQAEPTQITSMSDQKAEAFRMLSSQFAWAPPRSESQANLISDIIHHQRRASSRSEYSRTTADPESSTDITMMSPTPIQNATAAGSNASKISQWKFSSESEPNPNGGDRRGRTRSRPPAEPRPRYERDTSGPSYLEDHCNISCDCRKGISRVEADLERKMKELERKIDYLMEAYEGVLSRLIPRIQRLEHSRGGGGVFGKIKEYLKKN
jgi:hypothetical protein